MRDLTARQKLFVDEYLVDLNATRAAIRAGYSQRNADKLGSQLLGKTRVQEAIRKRQDQRQKRVEVSQDQVIQKLSSIAFGSVLDEDTWGPDGFKVQACIKALELLGRHLGMFVEQTHVTLDGEIRMVEVVAPSEEETEKALREAAAE